MIYTVHCFWSWVNFPKDNIRYSQRVLEFYQKAGRLQSPSMYAFHISFPEMRWVTLWKNIWTSPWTLFQSIQARIVIFYTNLHHPNNESASVPSHLHDMSEESSVESRWNQFEGREKMGRSHTSDSGGIHFAYERALLREFGWVFNCSGFIETCLCKGHTVFYSCTHPFPKMVSNNMKCRVVTSITGRIT